MRPIRFEGARVLLPSGLEEIAVTVEGGIVAELDGAASDADVIDARGLLLAPALVDIHGDAFERQLMPRPGVRLPAAAAMLETDRQLAANGIATAYHALTLSWEPGLRSLDTAEEIVDALENDAHRLTVENRLQLRWETFCSEAVPLVERALAGRLTPSVAFNDHTSMALLHPDTPLQERPFDHDPDFPVTDVESPAFAAKMTNRARRASLAPEAYVAGITRIWARRPAVPSTIAEVARRAREAGAPMLSHDDSRAETRRFYRGHGSRIAEFPMNVPTARAAREGGDAIVLGAPNAARGGSHLGSPGAADMIADGFCDILASDYYYPAMLAAIARLHADRAGELATLWPLVSANPARALGLEDRGEITEGWRADLVLIDWPEGGVPATRMTLSNGRVAYRATPAGA